MQKKITAIIVIIVALLIVFFAFQKTKKHPPAPITRSKVVIPTQQDKEKQDQGTTLSQDVNLSSLLPLKADETLLGVLNFDFDGDGFDDQVNYIKQAGNPNIIVILGMYNQKNGSFSRDQQVQTPISQVLSFSLQTTDLIGDHSIALVLQGTTSDNLQWLEAFLVEAVNNKAKLEKIADIKAQGAIFIETLDRYESYDLYQAQATSFPIYAYDFQENDQLQTLYNYSLQEKAYIKIKETVLDSSYLSQRQTGAVLGTVKSFSAFLSGLWYNTNAKDENQYLFFNDVNSEIIFLNNDTQEIYTWEQNALKHNGIYITANNASITNLKRRFDITLSSNDEIKVHIQDDVRMLINETNIWDGTYKKMPSSTLKDNDAQELNTLKTLLVKNKWTYNDYTIVFADDALCHITKDDKIITLQYATLKIQSYLCLEFRDTTQTPCFLSGLYAANVIAKNTVLQLLPLESKPNSILLRDLPQLVLEQATGLSD